MRSGCTKLNTPHMSPRLQCARRSGQDSNIVLQMTWPHDEREEERAIFGRHGMDQMSVGVCPCSFSDCIHPASSVSAGQDNTADTHCLSGC